MLAGIEFVLNGQSVRVPDCSTHLTLLEYLQRKGLTGSKEGCAEGDCGACSVAIIERDSRGRPVYRAINSCLTPLCLMAGREIVSVEGVARRGMLHPVQQQMVACHGSQCGYCTPGFIVSLFEGYYRDDIQNNDQLDDQICGNLCRCTGYRPIRDAAIAAFAGRSSPPTSDFFTSALAKARVGPGAAEHEFNGQRFFRPAFLLELLEAQERFPEGRLIAGATELGLHITKQFKKFPTLISVEAVRELKQIKSTDSEWHIGGAVTLTEIEEAMGKEFPALGDMLRVFGSRQIRNRATMGGNLVTASPIGDSAPVLLALDADVALASLESGPDVVPGNGAPGKGRSVVAERRMPIEQFFLAYRKTALLPGEVLKTIIVPRFTPQPGMTRKCEWHKVSRRREMDISIVAACFTVDLDAQGAI